MLNSGLLPEAYYYIDELVLQHSELRARSKVTAKNINSLQNWHYNNPTAINEPETKYIDNKKDLFALHTKSKNPLREWLEKSQRFRLMRLWIKPTGTPNESNTYLQDANIVYTRDKRLEMFSAFIVTILGLTMLIVPIWALAYVSRQALRLGLITAFIALFVIVVSAITAARPIETLAGAAAYVPFPLLSTIMNRYPLTARQIFGCPCGVSAEYQLTTI